MLAPILSSTEDDAPIFKLRDSLQTMPSHIKEFRYSKLNCLQMIRSHVYIFSQAMRILHNKTEVKSDTPEALNFAKICQQTKQNSLVFSKYLLPDSEKFVKMIRSLAIKVEDIDFADFAENLDDLREMIEVGERACNQLQYLHEALITEFKRSEDAALSHKGIEDLEKKYDKEKKEFEEAEANNLKKKAEHDSWANSALFRVVTFGIGTSRDREKAEQQLNESKENRKKAEACAEKIETAKEVFNSTENLLLPAIKVCNDFLIACNDFLITTRENMHGMKGGDGKKTASTRYFNVMKRKAKAIEADALEFMKTASETRTNLRTIKYDACDEQYAICWIKSEKQKNAQQLQ